MRSETWGAIRKRLARATAVRPQAAELTRLLCAIFPPAGAESGEGAEAL